MIFVVDVEHGFYIELNISERPSYYPFGVRECSEAKLSLFKGADTIDNAMS